ncbi:hypothetical protein [Streptomyces sp. SGAir0957]
MTLRSDVAGLLAEAGITDVDVDDAVADEHVRWSAYQRVIAVIATSPDRDSDRDRDRDRDRAIVATLLRDPLEILSKAAVVALVDRIARKATGPTEFRQWSARLLPEIERFGTEGCRAFVHRRIDDWLCWLAVEDGHVPAAAELAKVTYWMQRLLADRSTSPAVLALLAESGGSRAIRNVAKNRARSRAVRTR